MVEAIEIPPPRIRISKNKEPKITDGTFTIKDKLLESDELFDWLLIYSKFSKYDHILADDFEA